MFDFHLPTQEKYGIMILQSASRVSSCRAPGYASTAGALFCFYLHHLLHILAPETVQVFYMSGLCDACPTLGGVKLVAAVRTDKDADAVVTFS